jgi:hypothetical protein
MMKYGYFYPKVVSVAEALRLATPSSFRPGRVRRTSMRGIYTVCRPLDEAVQFLRNVNTDVTRR